MTFKSRFFEITHLRSLRLECRAYNNKKLYIRKNNHQHCRKKKKSRSESSLYLERVHSSRLPSESDKCRPFHVENKFRSSVQLSRLHCISTKSHLLAYIGENRHEFSHVKHAIELARLLAWRLRCQEVKCIHVYNCTCAYPVLYVCVLSMSRAF